jgi:lipopolysaccharide export system protein LptC
MSLPTDAAHRAIRFANLARLASWVALALAIGFVILFLVQAGLFNALTPKPTPPVTAPPDPDKVTATDSTVNGLDKQNQPYEVTAVRGWQDVATPSLVHMETVEGKFHRPGGKTYNVTAETGAYDTKIKELDLAGHVKIVQPDRFTALMDRAHVVVEDKKLTSDTPVDVTFPTGTIKANGLEITDDGARILFLNGVKARFSQATPKGDGQP